MATEAKVERRPAAMPRVRDYQREVVESAARFKLLLCGRRWGKTKMGVVMACEGHGPSERREGEERLRPRLRGALEGARVGWVVPSDEHPSAAEAWRDLKTAVGKTAWEVSEQKKLIELPGGGSVQLWSGYVPGTLRGPYFDGLIVDECSLQNEKLWEAARPTLSDYGGWGVLLGTVPEDVAGHWFAALHRYAAGEAGQAAGWATWRRPSWENPQLSEGDLKEARETFGARKYLREYGAELVGAEGGMWREEWFRFYDPDELPAADMFQRVEVYLDAAWRTGVRNCFSSCQAWGRTRDGYYLLGELRGKWEAPELRRRVASFREEWARRFPGLAVALVIEAAGGGAVVAQELREAYEFPVVEWEVKGATKEARSELVTHLAEGGKVFVPSIQKAGWVRGWLQEVVGFPELAEKDRVDAMGMALQRLKGYVEPYRAILLPRRADWDKLPF